MKRIVTSSFLVLAITASTAAAQSGPPSAYSVAPAGHHTHDGFYARAMLGLNGTTMRADDLDVEVSGAGGTFGLAAGYAVIPNLILYAEIFDDIAVSPTVSLGNLMAETSDDTSAGVIGFGAGAAYYFMPINLYISLTLAASQLTIQDGDNEVGNSEIGFGASVMVGKEWWVTSNWGLGVALQLYGGTMKDKGENALEWTTAAAALVFSATYN